MNWWKDLYMGKRAERCRPEILRGIREGRWLPDTYVITLPESGNHIFDIWPAALLPAQKERIGSELLILGVARGYREAAEVVRTMIDDMYRKTGAFDWEAYMEIRQEKERDL